jgi:hypothetical protein
MKKIFLSTFALAILSQNALANDKLLDERCQRQIASLRKENFRLNVKVLGNVAAIHIGGFLLASPIAPVGALVGIAGGHGAVIAKKDQLRVTSAITSLRAHCPRAQIKKDPNG